MELKERVMQICEALYDKKAQDIVAINVADKTIIADWFVICSGNVPAQVKALCDEVEEKAALAEMTVRRKDGYNEGRWVVLDFADILVHIFLPDERKYYNMERLWMDDPEHAILYSRKMEEELN